MLCYHVNAITDWTFKGLLEDYLESVDDCEIRTLEELIKFNEEHADQELPPSKYSCSGKDDGV